jgi:hypothetical protein
LPKFATSKPKSLDGDQGESAVIKPPQESPVPFRELLVPPVIVSVMNYATLAFLDGAVFSILPLFCATPVEFGGLGFSPLLIGQILSVVGFTGGFFQALLFARIVDRWGVRRVFFTTMCNFVPLFLMFPVISYLAHQRGMTPLVWGLFVVQGILFLSLDLAYG